MKDWEYYNNPKDIEYFGYQQSTEYEKTLKIEINNTPMTAAERQEAMKNLKQKVRSHTNEQNKDYREASAKLKEEFWNDAREELGYTDFLNEDGVTALEGKAYEDGHASGFGEVYFHLDELTDFARKMIENQKR